jgi:hypothetical protein
LHNRKCRIVTRHSCFLGISDTVKQKQLTYFNGACNKKPPSVWVPYYQHRHIELNLRILSITQIAAKEFLRHLKTCFIFYVFNNGEYTQINITASNSVLSIYQKNLEKSLQKETNALSAGSTSATNGRVG